MKTASLWIAATLIGAPAILHAQTAAPQKAAAEAPAETKLPTLTYYYFDG